MLDRRGDESRYWTTACVSATSPVIRCHPAGTPPEVPSCTVDVLRRHIGTQIGPGTSGVSARPSRSRPLRQKINQVEDLALSLGRKDMQLLHDQLGNFHGTRSPESRPESWPSTPLAGTSRVNCLAARRLDLARGPGGSPPPGADQRRPPARRFAAPSSGVRASTRTLTASAPASRQAAAQARAVAVDVATSSTSSTSPARHSLGR